jgi:hypothetical protein
MPEWNARKSRRPRRCSAPSATRRAWSPISTSQSSSSAGLIGIAWASRMLRSDSSDGRTRRQAVELVERTLRIVAEDDDQSDPALDERWLRDAAVRLAVSLDPTGNDAKAYGLGLRQHIAAIRWPAGIMPRTDLGMMLKAPAQKDWLSASGEGAETFASATIHSVKGRDRQRLVPDGSGSRGMSHSPAGNSSPGTRRHFRTL